MSAKPILELDNLQVIYDDVILALRDVSLQVAEGAVVALLGANGAGKTTALKAASGLLDAEGGKLARGRVHFQGRDISNASAHERVEGGLAQVLEGRHCFRQLTIEENLQVGYFVRKPTRDQLRQGLERIYHYFPRLKLLRKRQAGYASGGEQQMVAIGRALIAQPRLVLLDEPSMGLAPIMVQKIFEVVRAVAADGMTILLIEQNARLALQCSQRGYVMESGEISLHGDSAQLLDDPKVRAAYLGE